jgi:hypothetical protein
MWVPLTGQRSTLTGPRPGLGGPGQGWIWAGLGRSGPGRARHVSSPDCATSRRWISKMGLSRWAWLTVVTRSGFTGAARSRVDRVHSPPPLFGSHALGAPSSAAAPPSPSPLHGRASAGDERLIPTPRRLNNGVQGLYGFARTPGTRQWGPGGGLEFPVGLSTARCAAVLRCAHDEGEARRGRDLHSLTRRRVARVRRDAQRRILALQSSWSWLGRPRHGGAMRARRLR